MRVVAGSVAPVVRDADNKGLSAIAASVRKLAKAAQDGTLTAADVEGGTFTIINLGAYGIRQFSAIIAPPQVRAGCKCAAAGLLRLHRVVAVCLRAGSSACNRHSVQARGTKYRCARRPHVFFACCVMLFAVRVA